MVTAIHIYLSPFQNESRILKETKSLVDNGVVDRVIVLARAKKGLPSEEMIDEKRLVKRIDSRFQRDKYLKGVFRPFFLPLAVLDIYIKYIKEVRLYNPNIINLHQVALLLLIPFLNKRRVNKCYLVYDAHELETETNGLNSWVKKIFKWIEARYIKHFDLVIVVSHSIEQWYRNTYKIENVVTVLNCPIYSDNLKKDLFREEFNIPKDSKIFLYQGALFKGRGIETVLNAFSEINNMDFVLICMGYGELTEEVKSYALKHQNIFYKEAVAPGIVLNYTSSADVGLSLIENTCLSYYYCLPNKLFEYAMAGLPSLVSNLPEMREFILNNNMGLICDNNTTADLKYSINNFSNFNYDIFNSSLSYVRKEYNWETQERKMLTAYNSMLKFTKGANFNRIPN